MPASNSAHRAALVAAAAVGGVMVAIIIDIVLARRGIGLLGAWQGVVHSSGTPVRAAVAWWAIMGGAFGAGFVIAFVTSRFSWLYLRSLRGVAVGALAIGLSGISDLAPPAAAGAANHQALVTLGAMAAAMLMAGFGAFFAVRH